jgi:hypothetical protein
MDSLTSGPDWAQPVSERLPVLLDALRSWARGHKATDASEAHSVKVLL